MIGGGATRNGDPGTSRDAAERVDAAGLCVAVADVLRQAGSTGLTSLEASMMLARPGVDPVAYLQSISPRFAQLERLRIARVLCDESGPIRRNKRQVWVSTGVAPESIPLLIAKDKERLLDRFGNPFSDSYCTPRWLTALLPIVDTDPCSNPRSTVRSRRAYSLERRLNGLLLPWRGSAFVNWPYSDPMPWVEKLIAEWEAGRCTESIVLCKLDSSTEWWNTLVSFGTPELWTFDKRILFDEPPELIAERMRKYAEAGKPGKGEKSSTNFASTIIHHRGAKAPPLSLEHVATRWVRAA